MVQLIAMAMYWLKQEKDKEKKKKEEKGLLLMLPNVDDDLQIFFQMNYDILLMYKSVEVDIRMNYVSLSMCKKHES